MAPNPTPCAGLDITPAPCGGDELRAVGDEDDAAGAGTGEDVGGAGVRKKIEGPAAPR